MGHMLSQAWRRLRRSGLLIIAVMWGIAAWVSYYYFSQALVGPWQQRIYDSSHLDIGTLRLILATITQQTAFPLLALLFLLRLGLNPLIDAFVYGRLGQSSQPLWRQFIKLYIILYLAVMLSGWLLYSAAGLLLQLLVLHTFTFLFAALILWFCLALWLSLYKARLAIAARCWPRTKAWLELALARLAIISAASIGSLWLHKRAARFTGWQLGMILFLVELLAVWARLWQSSCAIEATNRASY